MSKIMLLPLLANIKAIVIWIEVLNSFAGSVVSAFMLCKNSFTQLTQPRDENGDEPRNTTFAITR